MGYLASLFVQVFVVISLLGVTVAAPVSDWAVNVSFQSVSGERGMVIASLIGVVSVMLVMLLSILLCMKSIMDAGSYETRNITIRSRATTSTICVDAPNMDQDTDSLREQEKNSIHVADLSRNSSLPLSTNRLPRYPTTLDFDAKVPLVASPNSIDVILRSGSETHVSDAGNGDPDE